MSPKGTEKNWLDWFAKKGGNLLNRKSDTQQQVSGQTEHRNFGGRGEGAGQGQRKAREGRLPWSQEKTWIRKDWESVSKKQPMKWMPLSPLPVPSPMKNSVLQTWRKPVLSLPPSVTQQWQQESSSFFLKPYNKPSQGMADNHGYQGLCKRKGCLSSRPSKPVDYQPKEAASAIHPTALQELQSWQGLKSSGRLLWTKLTMRTSLVWSSKAQRVAAEGVPRTTAHGGGRGPVAVPLWKKTGRLHCTRGTKGAGSGRGCELLSDVCPDTMQEKAHTGTGERRGKLLRFVPAGRTKNTAGGKEQHRKFRKGCWEWGRNRNIASEA